MISPDLLQINITAHYLRIKVTCWARWAPSFLSLISNGCQWFYHQPPRSGAPHQSYCHQPGPHQSSTAAPPLCSHMSCNCSWGGKTAPLFEAGYLLRLGITEPAKVKQAAVGQGWLLALRASPRAGIEASPQNGQGPHISPPLHTLPMRGTHRRTAWGCSPQAGAQWGRTSACTPTSHAGKQTQVSTSPARFNIPAANLPLKAHPVTPSQSLC